MHTTLLIVESPTKARAIAGYAGPDYTVRATFGHFRDLPKDELGIDPARNFAARYHITNRKTVQILRAAIARADRVVLATDPDREGEAIAWHVLETFKPELRGKPVARVSFHEITPQAVRAALAAPRALDVDLVHAQHARRILDRLVGYTLSPELWRNVRGPAGLSAGRVQTATLRLVVERDREIAAFIPEEYWTLDAELSAADAAAASIHFLARLNAQGAPPTPLTLTTEAQTQALIADLEGATYHVAALDYTEKASGPPAPYITSTLQRDAANRLHWTPKKTMQLAQQLFEGVEITGVGHVGLITYMRTDSTHVAPEAQTAAREVIAHDYGAAALPETPPTHHSKIANAQEAHEAIRPTAVARRPDDPALQRALSAEQAQLYALIWQRFIASQMRPALYGVTTVEVAAPGRSGVVYHFRAVGRKLLAPGYLAVYGEPEAATELPPLTAGESLLCHALLPERRFTQPPAHFTEASLIQELERRGIGRPSTYAGMVSAIQERGYTEKRGKALWATAVGCTVCDYLVEHFPEVFDLGFTAQLEARLDAVAGGGARWQTVLHELWTPLAARLGA